MYTEKLSISLVVDVGVLEGQLRAVQSVEVRVKQSHLGADSLVRVEGCHALQQIDLQLVQRWRVCLHGDASELREARFKVGQLQSIRPIVLVWSSEYLEDLKDMEPNLDRDSLIQKYSKFFKIKKLEIDKEVLAETSNLQLLSTLAMLAPFNKIDKQAILESANVMERINILNSILDLNTFQVVSNNNPNQLN